MSRILASAAAAALVLASCGTDDGASSSTTPDDELRPPVVVDIGAVGNGTGTEAAATDRVTADVAATDQAGDAELSILPWFGGFVFEVGEGLPPLPTNDTGYEFPAGAAVDADVVADLAAALGVEGDVVRGGGRDVDGVLWRVGPDDGSAPTVAVFDDAQLNWYFSPAWPELLDPTVEPAIEPHVGTGDADGDIRDVPATIDVVEPDPPVGVPDAADAEQRSRDLLGSLGQPADAFEIEVYADEWYASVTAWPTRDGVRWPMTWGFGFGENGELQWAGGSLAEPVPAGPYPLVDLDTALDRLNAQGAAWGGIAIDSTSDVARGSDPGEPTLDDTTSAGSSSGDTTSDGAAEPADADTPVSSDDDLIDTAVPATMPPDELVDPLPVEPMPVEPGEPELAVLVDVRADLWWVWDADGSVWLLPAYAFTDTEGRMHTVPAVTDEFMRFVDPPQIEPGIVDPVPPTEPVDPVEVDPVPAAGDGAGDGDGVSGETGGMGPGDETNDPGSAGDPGEVVPGLPEPIDLDDLDRDALVGATVEEATRILEADGNILRVIRLDGEDLAATMDLRPNRVNVAVEGDIVVELISVG